MNVISIQSQVAFGHVGNSAAVFPMQMHGIDVVAVPTTLLSNRPGYQTIRGRVLDAELLADLLRGIEERGAVDSRADDPVRLSRLGRQRQSGRGFRRARQGEKSRAAVLLRSRAGRSRPRPVRPRRHPAAGARPAVSARRYRHAQSFRVRMAERREGHHDRSAAEGGARVHGARHASSSPAPNSPIRPKARSRAWRSSAPTPGACARQDCRSARTAPAICSPRCWSPRASAASTTPDALSHAASAIFAVLERTAAAGTRGNAHRRERRATGQTRSAIRMYRDHAVGRVEPFAEPINNMRGKTMGFATAQPGHETTRRRDWR